MFDNSFDELMSEVDSLTFEEFGVLVQVDGQEPVRAIEDVVPDDFDAMSGSNRKLSFPFNVKVKKGDSIQFVSTKEIVTVQAGPYIEDGSKVVTVTS